MIVYKVTQVDLWHHKNESTPDRTCLKDTFTS